MKYGYLVLSLLCCSLLSAQRQASIWQFGVGQTIRFVAGNPVTDPTPSNIVAFEGSVSLADSTGQLLFYTNGGNKLSDNVPLTVPGVIWNRDGGILYDFAGITGGSYDAYQPALAFAKPAAPGIYCLFTVDELVFDSGGPVAGQPLGRGLRYFEIDRRANGGLGAVTVADQPVHVPALEGLSGTLHANGTDYWVVTYERGTDGSNDRFVVVRVSADGPAAPTFYPQVTSLNGVIKIAPDGNWLYCGQRIYPFDPATGAVGEALSGNFPTLSNVAATFTADSRFLYSIAEGGAGRRLVRFDLTAPVIAASEQVIAMFSTETFGQMQLAPNGRIYFHEKNFVLQRYGLSEIICPASPDPIVRHRVIPLTGVSASLTFGLPNYTDHIFRVEQRADTLEQSLETIALCPGGSVALEARYPGGTFQWSGAVTATGPTLSVSEPGDYLLTHTDTCGRIILDPKRVVFPPAFSGEIQSVSDQSFYCADDQASFVVTSTPPYDSLRWFDGSTADTLTITLTENLLATGIQATVFTGCDSEELSLTLPQLDTTGLRLSSRVMTDQLACGEEVELSVIGIDYDSLRWPDGSSGEIFVVELVEDSLYRVEVFAGCEVLALATTLPCQPECSLEVPNIFSPNRDNQNDEFGGFTNCELPAYSLRVFSRWGQLVFESDDEDRRWDGTKAGKPLPMDVYLYRITFRFPERMEAEVREGEVTLVR